MSKRIIRIVFITIILAIYILGNETLLERERIRIFTMPGLPRPIAKEPIIITSAGQGTDTYLINDISNRLMIRSYFLPQADIDDLSEAKTIVIVLDYSHLGLKLQQKSFEEENQRIKTLLEKAKDMGITILTIITERESYNNKEAKELLSHVLPKTDYLIGLRDSGYDSIISKLTEGDDIKLTLVNDVKDIYEPFASAFR